MCSLISYKIDCAYNARCFFDYPTDVTNERLLSPCVPIMSTLLQIIATFIHSFTMPMKAARFFLLSFLGFVCRTVAISMPSMAVFVFDVSDE